MLRCVKPSFWIEYFHRQTEPVRSSLDKSHHPIHCHFQGLDINPKKVCGSQGKKKKSCEEYWQAGGILLSLDCFAKQKPPKVCMSTDEKIKSCYNGTLLFYLSGGFLMLFGSEDFLPDGMPVMFPTKKRSFSHTKIRSFSNTKKRSFFNKNSVKSSTEFSPPPRFCAT